MTAAALYELLRARRSIRRYTPRAVPPEVVERLLSAAGWAPSSHNRQPWRFATLKEPEVKARLASLENRRKMIDDKDSKKPTLRRASTTEKSGKEDKTADDDRPTLKRRDDQK